ncbi:MAG: lysophospholipid acyltransferase family protein [Bacteroidia bacterium]
MIFRIIYSAWVVSSFFIALIPIILGAFIVFWLPEKPRLRAFFWITHIVIKAWSYLTGYRFSTEGLEHLENGPFVITPNHVNLLDMPVMGARFVHPFRPLAKSDFAWYPLLNILYFFFCIGVNRKDAAHRRDSQQRMLAALKRGISVMIFPEGTRNRTEALLQPFYSGAFFVAVEAQVPIVPVVQVGSRPLQPAGTMLFYPGKVKIKVLEPIPTIGLVEDDIPALIARVRAVMEKELR